MKITGAALLRQDDVEPWFRGEQVETMTVFDLGEVADPHDIALFVAWRGEREPEDHPGLGTLLVLIAPDGTVRPLLSTSTDGAAPGIQALDLVPPGHHRFEVRPITHIAEPDPTTDTENARLARFHASQAAMVSDRRALAVMPLEVVGEAQKER